MVAMKCLQIYLLTTPSPSHLPSQIKIKKDYFKVVENPFQNKFRLTKAILRSKKKKKKTEVFFFFGSTKNIDGMHNSSMKSSIKGPMLIIALIPYEICKDKKVKEEKKKKLGFH